MYKKILAFIFLFSTGIIYSQINELGVFVGGSNFIGDIGNTSYISPNSLAIGGIYKWNLNPHYSLRATYTYSKLTGDDSDSGNSYREYRGYDFTNTIHELAAGIEYHFFKYNLSRTGYRHTPYILLEASVTKGNVTANVGNSVLSGNTLTYSIPFGVGYKFPLGAAIGIGIETSFRYTFSDEMDAYPYEYEDQNGEKIQFGNSNGNDWYVFTGITIVYSFGREGCYSGNF
ncbi:MAG: DUF6089 family protein [Bacteroidota bacterium]